MFSPKSVVESIEVSPELLQRAEERFPAYGVMRLPFASGLLLFKRRSVMCGCHNTDDPLWVLFSRTGLNPPGIFPSLQGRTDFRARQFSTRRESHDLGFCRIFKWV